MNFKTLHTHPHVRKILIGLGIAIVALLIFQAGMMVGYHKARFAGNFGNNFERNFLGPRDHGMGMMFGKKMPGGHGAVGKIINIALPELTIAGPDNLEKTISIGTSTLVRRFQDETQASTLKVGEFVVVIGNPTTAGQIEAKLIRVLPTPPENIATTTSR